MIWIITNMHNVNKFYFAHCMLIGKDKKYLLPKIVLYSIGLLKSDKRR